MCVSVQPLPAAVSQHDLRPRKENWTVKPWVTHKRPGVAGKARRRFCKVPWDAAVCQRRREKYGPVQGAGCESGRRVAPRCAQSDVGGWEGAGQPLARNPKGWGLCVPRQKACALQGGRSGRAVWGEATRTRDRLRPRAAPPRSSDAASPHALAASSRRSLQKPSKSHVSQETQETTRYFCQGTQETSPRDKVLRQEAQ